jgi:hypothetical protein
MSSVMASNHQHEGTMPMADDDDSKTAEVLDVRLWHPDSRKALLPERCGARHPITKTPILIVRDEPGYYPWPADEPSPEDWNRLHDIDERTPLIMVAKSLDVRYCSTPRSPRPGSGRI